MSHQVQNRPFSKESIVTILQSYKTRLNNNNHLDLDDYLRFTDADYIKLTGFTRAQHNHVLSYIPATALKNSVTRSLRSALAYLLMKFKLGLSNSVLASLIGVNNKRQMSRIISNALVALVQHFTPHFLGLAHLTRQDVIDKHMSPIASRLLTEGRDPCILVLDGTYLYIQVRYIVVFLKLTVSFEKIEKSK